MKGYRELNENLKNQNNQCLKGTDAYFYQNFTNKELLVE